MSERPQISGQVCEEERKCGELGSCTHVCETMYESVVAVTTTDIMSVGEILAASPLWDGMSDDDDNTVQETGGTCEVLFRQR